MAPACYLIRHCPLPTRTVGYTCFSEKMGRSPRFTSKFRSRVASKSKRFWRYVLQYIRTKFTYSPPWPRHMVASSLPTCKQQTTLYYLGKKRNSIINLRLFLPVDQLYPHGGCIGATRLGIWSIITTTSRMRKNSRNDLQRPVGHPPRRAKLLLLPDPSPSKQPPRAAWC
jgi:hypothetical protein